MVNTVKKRIQSVLSLWAISIFRWQLVDNPFKELATVLVALELVEAGAGGRQQHGVAGHGVRVGMGDGRFDGLGGDQLQGAVPLVPAKTIEAAVAHAYAHAVPGDTVLLAPACASFDQFRSYEHRGQFFKQIVNQLPAKD